MKDNYDFMNKIYNLEILENYFLVKLNLRNTTFLSSKKNVSFIYVSSMTF